MSVPDIASRARRLIAVSAMSVPNIALRARRQIAEPTRPGIESMSAKKLRTVSYTHLTLPTICSV
eukprot:2704630-Rhodomonas_salina.2